MNMTACNAARITLLLMTVTLVLAGCGKHDQPVDATRPVTVVRVETNGAQA